MSMSTHIVGIKPPDVKWLKMKAIYDACVAADVDWPDEVHDFFGGADPDNEGVIVPRERLGLGGEAVRKYSEDGSSGYEVLIDKLPSDIKIIRFTNSW